MAGFLVSMLWLNFSDILYLPAFSAWLPLEPVYEVMNFKIHCVVSMRCATMWVR